MTRPTSLQKQQQCQLGSIRKTTGNNFKTLQDVKWQRRWELCRDLFGKIPTTKHSILYDFPTKRHFSIFHPHRTGYTELNYYKNQVRQLNQRRVMQLWSTWNTSPFSSWSVLAMRTNEKICSIKYPKSTLNSMFTRLEGEVINRICRFDTSFPQSHS